MKLISKISGLLFLSSLAFASCEDPEVTQNELSVEPSSMISFEATGNEDVILSVTTDAGEWDFTAPAWVTATPEGDKLIVNVKDNATGKTRNGRIEFTAGTAEAVKVNVLQKAAAPEEDALSVTPSEPIEFAASGNEPVVLTVETNVADWTFEKPEWVTAEKNADGTQLIVSVQDNGTEETLSDFIIISAGEAEPVTIRVSQEAKSAESSDVIGGRLVNEQGEHKSELIGYWVNEPIDVKVKISLDEAVEEDTEFELYLDESYVTVYNMDNRASFQMIPKDKVSLSDNGKILVEAGSNESVLVTVTIDARELDFPFDVDYLLPLSVKYTGTDIKFRGGDKRVNCEVKKTLNRSTLKNIYFCQVNDTNPLNALSFTLDDGTPFFDAIVLFSANLNYDSENNAPLLYYNPQVKYILDHSEELIQPLRKKGIKVYLGLLPNHDGVGLCNLSEEGSIYFAGKVADAIKTYKLDGVEMDEEYAKYSEKSRDGKYFSNVSTDNAMMLAYHMNKEMEKAVPWKTDICVYHYAGEDSGDLVYLGPVTVGGKTYQPEEFIDFGVADYGEQSSPAQGLPMSGCCGASIECDKGNNTGIFTSPQNAINLRDQGYGWLMWFALHPSGRIVEGSMDNNLYRVQNDLENVARGLYDSALHLDSFYRSWDGSSHATTK